MNSGMNESSEPEKPIPPPLSPEAEARRQLGISKTKHLSHEEYWERVNDPTVCDRCGVQHETVQSRTRIQVGLETRRLQYKFCDWCAKEVAEEFAALPDDPDTRHHDATNGSTSAASFTRRNDLHRASVPIKTQPVIVRRTLLAMGFAVLVSLVLVPHVIVGGYDGRYDRHVWRPFFLQDFASGRAPYYGDHVMWGGFILQTVFACVVAAMVVNIRWRRKLQARKLQEWHTVPMTYKDGDGQPYFELRCGTKRITTGPKITVQDVAAAHNSSLK